MHILAIGVATVDIINLVDAYPSEDEEVRASAQRRVRGGNATNTLVVLRQLGHRCRWGGVVAKEPDSRCIFADLERYDIETSACVQHPGGKAPTSYITLSRETGTRTIVHYRDLPEYRATDFSKIVLDGLDWVHFEGRTPVETAKMLAHLRRRRPRIGCSVEVEKPRPDIERLFEGPDVLLFSRGYALACGYRDGAGMLQAVRPRTGARLLFCAWGEDGAFAMDESGNIHQSPAFPPAALVDSIGAGDVFNAAVIDGCLRERPVGRVLEQACRLAGRKCGIRGFDGLDEQDSNPARD